MTTDKTRLLRIDLVVFRSEMNISPSPNIMGNLFRIKFHLGLP